MSARPTSRSTRIKAPDKAPEQAPEHPPAEEGLVDDLVPMQDEQPAATSSGVRSARPSARFQTSKTSRTSKAVAARAASQRIAKPTGSATSSSVRVAKPTGSATSSAVRAAKPSGSSTSSAVRPPSSATSSRVSRASNRQPFVDLPQAEDDLDDGDLAPPPPAEPVSPIRSGLFILAGVLGLGFIGFLVYVLVLKNDPAETDGRSALVEAERALNTAQAQLAQRQPEQAKIEVANAKKAFASVPALPRLAQRREEVKKLLESIQPRIDQVGREVTVDLAKRLLQSRLAKIGGPDLSDGDLARLEADCQAFVKNPLDPTAGPDPEAAKTYNSAVLEIKSRIGTVQAEKRRRQEQATSGQVTKVEGLIEPLVKEERFAEALALLDKTAKEFPDAKLQATRTYVETAAETAWTSLAAYVEMKNKDATSPAATASGREQVREGIRKRLDAAIATWGVEKYVSQAQELRKNY